ncbi:MAG: hypothetical protein AAGB12_13845 [Pseudomonadota bacterium]
MKITRLARHFVLFMTINLNFITTQANTYQTTDATVDWLGRGFNTKTGFTKSTCLNGEVKIAGNTQGLLRYDGSRTVTERIEEKFGEVKGSVNFVVFGGSVSVSVFSRVTDSVTSTSSSLRLLYQEKDYSLENRQLTTFGQNISKNPNFIYDNCGNEFVHSVKVGSELFVTAKLHFRTRESYERFRTKIKIRVLFIKKTKTITKEFREYAQNAVYSIQVNTVGGVTTKLKNILDNNPTHCLLDTIENCLLTSERIFDYLFDEQGYAVDLSSENLRVTEFTTQNYKDSGHFDLVPDLVALPDPGYRILERKLLIKTMESEALKEHFSAFLAVETDETIKERIVNKLETVNANLNQLQEAMSYCQQEPTINECRHRVDQALLQFVVVSYDIE